MTKKSQGLSLNTIIIAILVLIVLAVLIFFIFKYYPRIKEAESCEAMQGTCKDKNDCIKIRGAMVDDQKMCPGTDRICCIEADITE